MDTKIAQKRVDDLAAAMLAKGMRQPRSQLMLKSNEQPGVYMEWADDRRQFGTAYEYFKGDSIENAFDKASAFIAARPTAEQARLDEFMGALGKVIDLGRQNGIEADYLNPLVASMKKLSENIITDQRAA